MVSSLHRGMIANNEFRTWHNEFESPRYADDWQDDFLARDMSIRIVKPFGMFGAAVGGIIQLFLPLKLICFVMIMICPLCKIWGKLFR